MKQKENIFDNPKRLLTQGAVIVVGGFGVYFFGNKIMKEIQKRNTYDSATSSPEVQQAMVIRTAMNPSGISWLMSMDTTDAASIMTTARQISKLDEVSKAYLKLYNSEILNDLQTELDATDYQKFLTIVSANTNKSNPNAATNYAKKNQGVVAKVAITVRKSPDASYHGAFYESSKDNNIYWQAKAGEFIGYATGNQHFDEKNNVKFIQVAFLVKKEGLSAGLQKYAGMTYSAWVSASSNYVNIYNTEQELLSNYPNLASIVAYKKPLDYYVSTLKGLSCENAVISICSTIIFGETMTAVSKVESQTLLGKYIGELQMRNKTLVKFISLDNQEYWVNKTDIKITESC